MSIRDERHAKVVADHDLCLRPRKIPNASEAVASGFPAAILHPHPSARAPFAVGRSRVPGDGATTSGARLRRSSLVAFANASRRIDRAYVSSSRRPRSKAVRAGGRRRHPIDLTQISSSRSMSRWITMPLTASVAAAINSAGRSASIHFVPCRAAADMTGDGRATMRPQPRPHRLRCRRQWSGPAAVYVAEDQLVSAVQCALGKGPGRHGFGTDEQHCWVRHALHASIAARRMWTSATQTGARRGCCPHSSRHPHTTMVLQAVLTSSVAFLKRVLERVL